MKIHEQEKLIVKCVILSSEMLFEDQEGDLYRWIETAVLFELMSNTYVKQASLFNFFNFITLTKIKGV